MSDQEPLMVCMHPALVPAFKEWLASRGLQLGAMPLDLSAGLVLTSLYLVTPTDGAT